MSIRVQASRVFRLTDLGLMWSLSEWSEAAPLVATCHGALRNAIVGSAKSITVTPPEPKKDRTRLEVCLSPIQSHRRSTPTVSQLIQKRKVHTKN